jgi:deoxyribose-phosphate aldolase
LSSQLQSTCLQNIFCACSRDVEDAAGVAGGNLHKCGQDSASNTRSAATSGDVFVVFAPMLDAKAALDSFSRKPSTLGLGDPAMAGSSDSVTPGDIAAMIDHSLLHPTMTDAVLADGCALASKFGAASVCVKPYAVRAARAALKGSSVLVGTVIGFPSGASATAIKQAESEQAVADGAVELDMVMNVGKALSGDWKYVTDDIAAVVETAGTRAIVKVILETDFLGGDARGSLISRACQACSEAGAHYVKTSTGFGFVKGSDGKYSYTGATVPDIKLMAASVPSSVLVKASGGVRTLEAMLEMRAAGCTRVGATATASIIGKAEELLAAGTLDAAYQAAKARVDAIPATAFGDGCSDGGASAATDGY